MTGIFCRDIWGIIFDLIEEDFDPFALNNLSATCRKLHDLDMQHRQCYIRAYEKQGPLIEKLKKGRQDYVKLVRYSVITCHFYKHYYFQVTFTDVIKWLRKQKNIRFKDKEKLTRMTEEEIVTELLEKTDVKKFKEDKGFDKDIELIRNQVDVPDYCCVFSLIKNRGDIVNTIMELQFD